MRIHLIAIGGAAMHNLALALQQNGHVVTGSDDEIYNPAAQRLQKAGLFPDALGWNATRITADLDCIILGMHARIDNPELLAAQALGLSIYSYPEFIYQHAKDKKRIVIAGSHGKTTTTSMIMHALKYWNVEFDYLVGAMLEGFETMVRLSDAPVMVIEGDEYLSSPIDRQPKIMHYHPHTAILTGIAWDHVNVFPTFALYVQQFRNFVQTIDPKGKLFFYRLDENVVTVAQDAPCFSMAYGPLNAVIEDGKTIVRHEVFNVPLQVFGKHNLANMRAAQLASHEAGISDAQFFEAMQTFTGAAKRLQLLAQSAQSVVYLDFAHAPSKVQATMEAVKAQFPKRHLIAGLELHTFSSLNEAFLPEYRHTLAAADEAFVFFNAHTFEIKKMPPLDPEIVAKAFDHPNLHVFTDNQTLVAYLKDKKYYDENLLLMTSGTFNGLDLKNVAEQLLEEQL